MNFCAQPAPRLTHDEARDRLNAILNDRVMRFNPYLVDDETLLECAERGHWLGFPSLTQMVIFHFQEIREVKANRPHHVISFRIGRDEREQTIPLGRLVWSVPHHFSKHQIWIHLNDLHLTRSIVGRLENSDMFISHALVGHPFPRNFTAVYRMYKLYGNCKRKAAVIRRSMLNAKIYMLEEVIRYPRSPFYLGNIPDDFDYGSSLVRTMNALCDLRHKYTIQD